MKITSEGIAVPELLYFGMIAITILLLAISIFGIILYENKGRKQKKLCCYAVFAASLIFLLLISKGKIMADTMQGNTISQTNFSEGITILEMVQNQETAMDEIH